MNKNRMNLIFRNYEDTRARKIKEHEMVVAKTYLEFPRLEEIDNEIKDLSLSAIKVILNKNNNLENAVEENKKNVEKLSKEKNDLIESNSLEFILEPKWECKYCKDTAFDENGRKCNCFKQKIIRELYDMSNLGNILEEQNFETFDINLFSDEESIEWERSPRKNMEKIWAKSRNFVKNFDKRNEENLLLYGDTGLGKTFLCSAIANEVINKGHTVLYQSANYLMDLLERRKFRKEKTFNDESYDLIFNVELLIIDDLGTEMITSFTVPEIFNIINQRILNHKKTIISTNLKLTEISEVYTQRVGSRIFQKYKPLKFYGKDLRWQK